MAEISEEQKNQVASWIRDGAGLGEVQKRLQSEFNVNMTYMDVRFLVDDLDVELVDKSPKKQPELKQAPKEDADVVDFEQAEETEDESPRPMPDDDEENADTVVDLDMEDGGGTPGNVTVQVDNIAIPGAIVSGSATMSDGTKLQWMIDQLGRPGIVPPYEGYKPKQEDMAAFQTELANALQQKGL